MKQTLFIFLFLAALALDAQTVLLNVDRKAETRIENRGPNLKKFSHFYIRGGMYVSEDHEGARIKYGPSVNLAFGVRVKYKISKVYSIGYEIENQYADYKLKQDSGKILPDPVLNDMSRFDYNSLCAGFYNRFNFDPNRGNYFGYFLDVGISGECHYSIKYVSKNDAEDGTLIKTTFRHLNYTNNFNAKIFARLGYSHFCLFGSYRLFDLFKPSYNYPDLPKIAIGIDLAIF